MDHAYSSRLSAASGILFRLVGDEAVILNLKSEKYLGLDPIGTRIWTLLNCSGSIQEAYESLVAEFDVDPARLREDLDDLTDQLLEQGLIEITPVEKTVI